MPMWLMMQIRSKDMFRKRVCGAAARVGVGLGRRVLGWVGVRVQQHSATPYHNHIIPQHTLPYSTILLPIGSSSTGPKYTTPYHAFPIQSIPHHNIMVKYGIPYQGPTAPGTLPPTLHILPPHCSSNFSASGFDNWWCSRTKAIVITWFWNKSVVFGFGEPVGQKRCFGMKTRLICWRWVFWIWTSLANFGNFCSYLGRYVLGKIELKAQGSAAAAKVVHCTIKTQLFTTSSSSSDQSYCWNAKCITQLDFTLPNYSILHLYSISSEYLKAQLIYKENLDLKISKLDPFCQ